METPAKAKVAYQRDGVGYLDRIATLFGGYKRRGIELIKPFAGMRLLDAGCGTGDDARALAALAGPRGDVVGLEVSDEMLAAARQRSGGADEPVALVKGDIGRMPFPDARFDRVRSDRVFQHLADPEAAVREMMRVLAHGGWMAVMDVDWATLVIDGVPTAFTEKILRFHFTRHINGSAGRLLFGMLKRAGLLEIEAVSETVIVNDLNLAFFLWGLDATLRDVVANGMADEKDVACWVHELRSRDRAGSFFSAITGFGVCGRKPQ